MGWHDRLLKPHMIYSKDDLRRHEVSRMSGFLDCLRFLGEQGLPEQAYVDYLLDQTDEAPVPLMDLLKVKIKEKL